MDINPEDYPEARKLQPGDSIKVPHLNCSGSAAMKIRCEVAGLRFYCHKCGSHHFESSFNSPRERLRRQAAYDATMKIKADGSFDLPADFSQTLPPNGLAWLGAGGWTLEMQKRYKVGWSERLNRVIIPVCPIGYIARSVESWQKPKYIEKAPENSYWVSGSERTTTCVITEDILSAGRCGKFMQAFSILGTSLSTAMLNKFLGYKTIFVWLDPDRGGINGVKNMSKRIMLVCDDVRIITSESDPKCLSDDKIKELLT